MKQFFSIRSPLTFAALVAATALSACKSDNTTGTGTPTPTAIAPAVTPAATAQVATAIPGPAVTVTGAGGAPAAGVLVTFGVTAGGGALEYPIATTDVNGVASSGLWQIGPTVGVNTSTATVTGVAPLTFTVTSTPGPPAKIAAQAGNNQAGAPGSTLPLPLTARVADAGGNPKPGVVVTFAVASGGGSITGTSATTNASGDAVSGPWTLGGQCLQQVSGTAGTLSTFFTANARSTITVGGTATGTLSSSDCVIGGAFTDEYDLTTSAGAINVSLISTAAGATVNALTADATVTIASDPTLFRLITAASAKTISVSAPGGATGAYTVSVASTSSDVSDCSTVYLEIGASSDQTLAPTDCNTNYRGVAGDAFLVYIPVGMTVKISQTAQPLDAKFALFGPSGNLITEVDNGGIGASQTEVLTYKATTSGYHKIVASSYCLTDNDPYTPTCSYGPYTVSVIKP